MNCFSNFAVVFWIGGHSNIPIFSPVCSPLVLDNPSIWGPSDQQNCVVDPIIFIAFPYATCIVFPISCAEGDGNRTRNQNILDLCFIYFIEWLARFLWYFCVEQRVDTDGSTIVCPGLVWMLVFIWCSFIDNLINRILDESTSTVAVFSASQQILLGEIDILFRFSFQDEGTFTHGYRGERPAATAFSLIFYARDYPTLPPIEGCWGRQSLKGCFRKHGWNFFIWLF